LRDRRTLPRIAIPQMIKGDSGISQNNQKLSS